MTACSGTSADDEANASEDAIRERGPQLEAHQNVGIRVGAAATLTLNELGDDRVAGLWFSTTSRLEDQRNIKADLSWTPQGLASGSLNVEGGGTIWVDFRRATHVTIKNVGPVPITVIKFGAATTTKFFGQVGQSALFTANNASAVCRVASGACSTTCGINNNYIVQGQCKELAHDLTLNARAVGSIGTCSAWCGGVDDRRFR